MKMVSAVTGDGRWAASVPHLPVTCPVVVQDKQSDSVRVVKCSHKPISTFFGLFSTDRTVYYYTSMVWTTHYCSFPTFVASTHLSFIKYNVLSNLILT